MSFKNLITGKITEEQRVHIWENIVKPVVLKKVNRPKMTQFQQYSPSFFEVKIDEIIVTSYVEMGNVFGGSEIQDFRVTLDLAKFKVKKVEFLIRGLISNKDKWKNHGN